MTAFWISSAALAALALAFLLPTLLRHRHAPTTADYVQDAHLVVLREQLAQIDAELADGTLDQEQHRLARAEIERRALEEETRRGEPGRSAPNRAAVTAAVFALGVPFLAFGLYSHLGKPAAADDSAALVPASQDGKLTPEQIEAMIKAIERRLEGQPDQPTAAEGWALLGRVYGSTQRFAEASRAFARSLAIAPNDAQVLADQADVLAMLQGQSVTGEPARLAARALQIDPQNVKALALNGTAAFERKDFPAAADYWRRARALAPPGSGLVEAMDRNIAQAQTAQKPGSSATLATAQVSGTVRVAPALASRVAPGDTVFIFARASEGPRMPLAILKRKAGELPIAFTLDDAMAMSPTAKLSMHPMVVVGARVSKSGNAMPQSGDLSGQSAPVKTGSSRLHIVIDSVQP
jgi:cytochrome c-type biogenesis protein CcmH